MLEKFREVYNKELRRYVDERMTYHILNSPIVRAFVYEVCKNCFSSIAPEVVHSKEGGVD